MLICNGKKKKEKKERKKKKFLCIAF